MPPRNPDPLTGLALTVAVIAVSSSGPLIAFAAAPALAIAFWRNAMAVGVLAPAVLIRRRPELRALVTEYRREGLFCVLAGVALAAHFGLWIPSVKLTSIATATALVATQPVWQGLIAVGQGRRLSRATWVGISVAVAGAMAATGADIGHSVEAVVGDILAVLGGVMAAVYTALGEKARVHISTTAYTAVCYTTCAALLLVVCLTSGQALAGYALTTWLALVALTVGPQLLGHSLFNFAVKRVPATTISVLILLEVPGAALIGWAWLGQAPRLASLPGLALLMAGVVIVVLASRRATTRPPLEQPEANVISP